MYKHFLTNSHWTGSAHLCVSLCFLRLKNEVEYSTPQNNT